MKNILLLALSVFSRTHIESEDRYEYNIGKNHKYSYVTKQGESLEVEGYYQLEPIPNLLIKRGISLDEVIILATGETRKAVEVTMADDIDVISPEKYFQNWIETSFENALGKKPVCYPIEVDESNPAIAVRETVKELQAVRGDDKTKLYVDTHGGFRSVQLIVEAVIKLLQEEKLELNVYNVQFSGGDAPSLIVRDEAIRIFDFVSGINEFMNYGRIDSLLRFIDYEANRRLIKPIQEISEGILWCNIKNFENGLRHLKNYYKSGERTIKNEYLKIFEERIRSDYGELLEDNSVDDAVAMVSWCLKKGFYQQALTLIEAKVPDSLIQKKNIYALTEEGEAFRCKRPMFPNTKELAISDVLNGCTSTFSGWLGCWRDPHDNKAGNRKRFNQIFSNQNRSFGEITDTIMGIINGKIHERSFQDILKECQNYSSNQNGSCDNAISFTGIEDENWCRYVVILLFLHRTLKKARNDSNHALEESRFDTGAIRNAIRYYLELVDKVSFPLL